MAHSDAARSRISMTECRLGLTGIVLNACLKASSISKTARVEGSLTNRRPRRLVILERLLFLEGSILGITICAGGREWWGERSIGDSVMGDLSGLC